MRLDPDDASHPACLHGSEGKPGGKIRRSIAGRRRIFTRIPPFPPYPSGGSLSPVPILRAPSRRDSRHTGGGACLRSHPAPSALERIRVSLNRRSRPPGLARSARFFLKPISSSLRRREKLPFAAVPEIPSGEGEFRGGKNNAGFRKHGVFGPALLLCLAVFIFLVDQAGWLRAVASGPWHNLPMALGALTLAISQFWNRRMLRSLDCNHDGCNHSHRHG